MTAALQPAMVLGYDFPLLSLLLSSAGFIIGVAYLVLLFTILREIFHRRDLRGITKATWLFVIVVAPIVGVLIYAVVRGDVEASAAHRSRMGDERSSFADLQLRG